MLPSFNMSTSWDNFVENLSDNLPLIADVTVTVGGGGDYATINDALEALTRKYPTYKANGHTAEISLLSGFVMAEQVFVVGVDLGWIEITSVDAEVTIQRSALTQEFRAGRYPAFGARRATLPYVRCIFNMDTSGTATNRDGFGLWELSKLNINQSGGVQGGIKNAATKGVWLSQASILNADRGVISHSGEDNVFVSECSVAELDKADLSNAGRHAIKAEKGARVYAGADGGACDLSNAGDHAIAATYGSFVSAMEATITNAGGRGVSAVDGCMVDVRSADISGATSHGIYAEGVSVVNAGSANISGAGGHGVWANRGSKINVNNANCQKGASPHNDDIHILRGSIISAQDATGGALATVNTVSQAGIVFR